MLWGTLKQKKIKTSLSKETSRLVDYYVKYTGKDVDTAIETLIALGFEYWSSGLKEAKLTSDIIEDNLRYRSLLLEASERIRTLTVIIESLLRDIKLNDGPYTKKHERIEKYLERLYEYCSMLVIEATSKK